MPDVPTTVTCSPGCSSIITDHTSLADTTQGQGPGLWGLGTRMAALTGRQESPSLQASPAAGDNLSHPPNQNCGLCDL